MYGIIIAIFALTVNLITERAIIARKPEEVRAFFMPIYQVNDIAVACTFEVKPVFSHSNFSLCDGFTVGGNGGSRFLICYQTNSKSMSKKVKTTLRTTAQLIKEFKENFIAGEAAGDYAKHLRITCATALQNPDPPLDRVLSVLYLAEFLQDIATSFLIPNSHIPNSKNTEGGKP